MVCDSPISGRLPTETPADHTPPRKGRSSPRLWRAIHPQAERAALPTGRTFRCDVGVSIDIATALQHARVIRRASPSSDPVNLPLRARRLTEAGLKRRTIDDLVSSGELRRLRVGWFADASTHPDVAAAVAAGGTLTCESALVAHGGWSLDPAHLHVRFPESRAPRAWRAPRELVRHGSRSRSLPNASTALIDDPIEAIRCASLCLPDEDLLVVVDAARNRGLVTDPEFESLVESLPAMEQSRFTRSDKAAGSGSETRVRLFFEKLSVPVQTQLPFALREFADMLIDGWIALECDSVEHHAGRVQFIEDRRRTLELQRDWYFVVRLTYDDIWYRWDEISAFLFELVRRGPRAIRPGDRNTRRRLRRRSVHGGV